MSSHTTALVTGAAARIGAAIARKLHARGCNVVVHFNANEAGAADMVRELNGKRTDSAVMVPADLSRMDGVERLAGETLSAASAWGGSLGVLVNNASRFYPTKVAETRLYEWDDLLNSNLRGPYFLVQALLESLQGGGGSVINILDIHSERPMNDHAVYCISKAGLNMMTRALARELGPDIRVNGVSPGAILWPERDMAIEVKDEILRRTALGRLGEPDDIASAVAYLALDAPYVTGEIINVDGGRTLNI